MPVKQTKKFLRHLIYFYMGLFLLSIIAVSWFWTSEHSVHQKVAMIAKINDAIHDVDDAVMHIVLADVDPVHWEEQVVPVLLEQSIKSLAEISSQNDISLISALEADLNTLKMKIATDKFSASNNIIQIKMQLRVLHQRLIDEVNNQAITNVNWFYVVLLVIFILTTFLFFLLVRSGRKQNSFQQSFLVAQERLTLIVNNMDEVFFLCEKETGVLLYVSPLYSAMWGISLDELCVDPNAWQSKVHPDDLSKLLDSSQCPNKDERTVDFRIIPHEGSLKWIRQRLIATRAKISDDGMEKEYFITVFSDITEVKKLNDQLAQSQRLDALGRVTGGVAHDFNNLLTVIMGNAQLIEDNSVDLPPFNAMAGLIIKAAERGAKLNRQLLTFAGKQQQQLEYVDICEVILETQNLMSKTLGENITLEIKTYPNKIGYLIDVAQLQSAVINLCFNARDAMPNGGEITIELEQMSSNAPIIIRVSDTGTGIPEHMLNLIFEPFFTTKASKGSGLGLSMVYGFVKQCQGEVTVASQADVGTTFTLTFPSKETVNTVSDSNAAASYLSNQKEPKKCLIVEDNELVRDSIVSMLEEQGFIVETVSSCDEGKEKLEANSDYDILISDVVTPGQMNGFDLARLCATENPTVNILLMSGYYDDKSYSAEAFHFLAKPFTHNQLMNALSAVIAPHELK